MDDLFTRPPDDPRQGDGAGAPVSMGRRRFAKGAAPVVLGSLLSQPVLGAEYICTVSGHASGNASAHRTTDVDCDVGNTPEEWRVKAATEWPSAIMKGELPAVVTSSATPPPVVETADPVKGKGKKPKGDEPQPLATSPTETLTTTDTCTVADPKGTAFNGYAGLADTFYYSTTSCALGTTSGTENAASMHQILAATDFSGDAELLQLGRAVVASLLNTMTYDFYPVSEARIVAMFNAVKDGGSYFVEGPKLSLTRTGVIRYLEKLYS